LDNIKKSGKQKGHLLNFVVQQVQTLFPNDPIFCELWLSMWQAPKVCIYNDITSIVYVIMICNVTLIYII
jgi:hypothetical protein